MTLSVDLLFQVEQLAPDLFRATCPLIKGFYAVAETQDALEDVARNALTALQNAAIADV